MSRRSLLPRLRRAVRCFAQARVVIPLRRAKYKYFFEWRGFGDDIRIDPDVQVHGAEGIRLGSHVELLAGVTLGCGVGATLEIGDNTFVGPGCTLLAYGKISVGRYVMFAREVIVVDANHVFAERARPMRLQGRTLAPVTLGDDAWLGARAIVLPGVTIGQGAIVGAGAVVTRDVAPYTIVAGVPARVIGRRP